MKNTIAAIRSVVVETWSVYLALLKVLVPAIIVVKVMQEMGWVGAVAGWFEPLMDIIGLPPELSLVWATAMFTNIYAGLVVFFTVVSSESLSVAQVTTLGVLILVCHSIPVEGAVAKRIGVPWWMTLLLRVAGAFLFAWLLHTGLQLLDWWQQPAEYLWLPPATDGAFVGWLLSQLEALITVFFIIMLLVVVLRFIKGIDLDKLLHSVVYPLLVFIGLRAGKSHNKLAEMTIVGMTLGLTYGAGLLIKQRDSGAITTREARVVGSFIGVCHGLIDDTLLVLLLGAHIGGILPLRIVFALLVVAVMTRTVDWCYRSFGHDENY